MLHKNIQYRPFLRGIYFMLLNAFILLITLPVKGQEIITLQGALDSTMKNNLQIRQAEFQAALSDQDVFQSRMNLFPTLNGGVGGSVNWGSFFDEKTGTLGNTTNQSVDGSLSASVTLFQGFQKINEIAYNKAKLLADKSYKEQVQNEMQLAVFTTYMEGLTNRDLMEASQQQLTLSQEQLAVEEIQVEAGNKTLADLAQAKSQVAQDELNVTATQNAYALSILTLKQQMEMDMQKEVVLEKPSLANLSLLAAAQQADEIYNQALTYFPEIKKAAFDRIAAERNLKIAKGAYYPTLSFFAGLSSAYTTSYRDSLRAVFPFREQVRNNFGQSFGVSLNIPIFNQLSSRIGVKKARISLENSRVVEQQAKNALNKVIHQAMLDFRSSQKRHIATEQAFIAMNEAFVVIKERYGVGLANSIELSTAQTNRNKAEFDFISSKYNVLFRNKVIDYYLGNPLYF